MPLYVLSSWYNTRDDSEWMKLERVESAEEAQRKAAEYRERTQASSTGVDEIVLIEGQRL